MSKYWGIIVANRPHIFSLGSHDDYDKAARFARDFIERKNEEIQKEAEEKQIPQNERRPDYDLLWILDENELRGLIGEVHRPIAIGKPKREAVGVEAPIRRGGAAPVEVPAPDPAVADEVVEEAGE